jgi:hypothetical protein
MADLLKQLSDRTVTLVPQQAGSGECWRPAGHPLLAISFVAAPQPRGALRELDARLTTPPRWSWAGNAEHSPVGGFHE